MNSKAVVQEIDTMLRFIREQKLMKRGYMCGYVNGLRWVRAKILGEEPIFERNEVQPTRNKKLEAYAKETLDQMHIQLMELIEQEKIENGKHRKTKHKKAD